MLYNTIRDFYMPLKSGHIVLVESKIDMDTSLVQDRWNERLNAMQATLQKQGIQTHKRPYNELDALYEGERALMWPGKNVTLLSHKWKGTDLELLVALVSYPASLCHTETALRPSFGISTLVHTSDEMLVLTRRGQRTSMYPNRLCGVGGVPDSCTETVLSHQNKELHEEIGLEKSEYKTLFFDALLEDNELHKRGAVLTGHTRTYLAFKEINERMKKRAHHPPDVEGVQGIPAWEGQLFDYLASQNKHSFVPTTLGGIICYGEHLYGSEWSKQLLKKMQN